MTVKRINVEEIQQVPIEKIVLIGLLSGKMYLPSQEGLDSEGFALVKPLQITSEHTREELKEAWDDKKEVKFEK